MKKLFYIDCFRGDQLVLQQVPQHAGLPASQLCPLHRLWTSQADHRVRLPEPLQRNSL